MRRSVLIYNAPQAQPRSLAARVSGGADARPARGPRVIGCFRNFHCVLGCFSKMWTFADSQGILWVSMNGFCDLGSFKGVPAIAARAPALTCSAGRWWSRCASCTATWTPRPRRWTAPPPSCWLACNGRLEEQCVGHHLEARQSKTI